MSHKRLHEALPHPKRLCLVVERSLLAACTTYTSSGSYKRTMRALRTRVSLHPPARDDDRDARVRWSFIIIYNSDGISCLGCLLI